MTLKIIGGGLAGCEAAWQAANRGVKVRLFDMKPREFSPAHKSENLCELVCSNSLKSQALDNACGLLKSEMRVFDSLLMACAEEAGVPAGGALAVDRGVFSELVTNRLSAHGNIEIIRRVVEGVDPDEPTVVATGPLTHPALAESLKSLLGGAYLYFYDAASPIVEKDSIDFSKVYYGARYQKGDADYINCPFDEAGYQAFYTALISAESAPLKADVERPEVFEGCMPLEIMAKRGEDTLRFGPLKPKGLPDPRTGREPYAVAQLRQDNKEATLYNLVGFQTNLKFGEQKRVFSMIPGLENADFVRYGVMHRNTYINSPGLLDCFYRLKTHPKLFFAGQITGVEGYVESAASGLCAGMNAARVLLGKEPMAFSGRTCMGALARYISGGAKGSFQPMNANFGIIEPLEERVRNKKERCAAISARSLSEIRAAAERGAL